MLGRWWADLIIKGSNEARFLPELNISPKDVVIPKTTYSAFHKTGFEETLKEHGHRWSFDQPLLRDNRKRRLCQGLPCILSCGRNIHCE